MKHTLRITIFLILLFFLSQVVGLAVINQYIDHQTIIETGKVTFEQLPYDIERPNIDESTSFVYIIIAIIIGTVLLLTLIKFKKVRFWKVWYFLSVTLTLSIAFSAFIDSLAAFIIALIISFLKVYKQNFFVHNFSELFIYGGLAAIFVPIMNIFAIFILLIFISLYDMYAVWKSKHMVSLAKFQANSNVFAGLSIPYPKDKKPKQVKSIDKQPLVISGQKIAILGGGDIGFPLLFAGVLMKEFMKNYAITTGFLLSLIVPFFVTIALAFLFIKGKPNKFYPAMPFLSIGCLVGFIVIKIFKFL